MKIGAALSYRNADNWSFILRNIVNCQFYFFAVTIEFFVSLNLNLLWIVYLSGRIFPVTILWFCESVNSHRYNSFLK